MNLLRSSRPAVALTAVALAASLCCLPSTARTTRAPASAVNVSLTDVVNFYDSRFSIGLRAQEKSDLIAFLKAL